MIFHVNPLLEASRLDMIGKLGIFNVNRLLEDDNDGKVSLPGLSCHDVTDRVFPYNLGFTVYLRRCYGRYGGKCR